MSPASETEKEVKITLRCQGDLDRFTLHLCRLACCSVPEVQDQVNVIYTNDYLLRERIVLRVRQVGDRYTLTTKHAVSSTDGYF